MEELIQSAKESADGHETLFKEIVGDKNLGLTLHWWNSLFFWVDIETRLLKCYDMEHRATAIFEGTDNLVGLNVSTEFAVGRNTSFNEPCIPQLTFNNNRLYY